MRVVVFTAAVFLSLVLVAFLSVQIQQRMLRWRAEQLSADMNRIRLYQSTWSDAQRLMTRWGAWGYYDGSCTAASCKYEIEMGSAGRYNPRVSVHPWLYWLLTHDRFNLYHRLGGRGEAFHASFTVHDGTIWREGRWFGVEVPNFRMRTENDFDWSLSLGAVSRQRLHPTLKDWTDFMGDSEDELAQHPYYKVGRPGGCMINCQMGIAYYSTHTPPAEIERLTAYNFSCLTRLQPCAHIEDLLPASEEWHLYDKYSSSPTVPIPPQRPEPTSPPKPRPPCDVPVWALARDAHYVLSVETISVKIVKENGLDAEMAKVRVVDSLKEPAPWLPSALVDAYPYGGSRYTSPPEEAEHLAPGKRFIVFPIGNDRRDQMLTKDSPIRLERCGVQEDTPETRRELEIGFAQNDSLSP